MLRKLAIAGIVLVVVGIPAALAIRAGLIANEAEHNLQAARLLGRVLEDYIHENGEWPANYEALERYPSHTSIYAWPEDREEILKRARVNFDFTLDEVAASRPPHRFLTYERPMFETVVAVGMDYVVAAAKRKTNEE